LNQVLPPANWYADPLGRHEVRYWDGSAWTELVATGGVEGTDPLASSGPGPTASGSPGATTAEPGATTAEAGPPDPPHGQTPVPVHESLLARLHHRVERHHAEAETRRQQERRAKATAGYQKKLAEWQEDQTRMQDLVHLARDFTGITSSAEAAIPVVLKPDEHLFYVLEGAQLIEPKRLPGHWVGGYSGFSFRIAKGVRYHVGGTRGHYQQGEERPAPIDMGTVTITDKRVVFQGTRQVREWAFARLIGYQNDPRIPMTNLEVSNRQKVSGFLYDHEHAESVHFRLALAVAHHQGSVDDLVGSLERELAEHEAAKPVPPSG
jgi:uncharacterized protein DUF2510